MTTIDKKWAEPPMPRHQLFLCTSLDDLVAPDHVVRIVDATLEETDWSQWERRYLKDRRGQPPIHPRLLAGVILYGVTCKLGSSRELEMATRERLDFMWLLQGRTIDHSTFAKFRTAFGEELKELNRQFARRICQGASNALEMLLADGTRLRANSDRHGARTAETLERLIAQCSRMLDERLAQMDAADKEDARESERVAELETEIAGLRAEIARYEAAACVARARDEERRKKEGNNARPVSVPVTDPDSMIVPNKEGGYAPNYTPAVVTDAATGAIILPIVPEGSKESSVVMPGVEEARRLGGDPKRFMADSAFGCGDNLKQLDEQGIEACMPTGTDFRPSNPANRPDPTQPVPEDQWDRLPMTSNEKLRSSAFIYDAENDEYRCPMGKALTPQSRGCHRSGASHTTYACPGKTGCPLAGRCAAKDATARTIARDEYQDLRDKAGQRMATDEGSALYKKRAPLIEVVFARIKARMGIRAFLLRGLDKVRTEWTWVCCAYNLTILLKLARDGQKDLETAPPTPGLSLFSRLTCSLMRLVGWNSRRTTDGHCVYA